MYLNITDNGTTITVGFSSSEQAVWTIATDNAVLITNKPTFAEIRDDHCWWYCTPDKLIRYQHTTGTIAGMALDAGNTYCVTGNLTNIGTDHDFYPCDATTNTNKTAIATQLSGTTNPPTINTGTGISDLNIPLTTSGSMATDGAQHIDLSSHVAKITHNQDAINQSLVLYEASVRTGSVASPTEHLLSFWDCSSTTLNTGTGSVTVTNATYNNGERGNGILVDANAEVAYLQSSGNIAAAQGTLSFGVKCTGTATAGGRFFQHSSATDEFELYWTNATTIAGYVNQTSVSFTVSKNPLDGELHNIVFTWDTSNNICYLFIDGKLQDTDTTTITAPTFTSGNLYVGNSSAGTNPINGVIDNFTIHNAPIPPYGTMIPGNLSDYTKAHSDITAYVHGDEADSDSLKIGTGSITVVSMTHVTGPDGVSGSAFHSTGTGAGSDRVAFPFTPGSSFDTCKISCWYKHNDTSSSGYASLCGHSSSANALRVRLANATTFYIYGPDGSAYDFITVHDYWDGGWHYLEFSWDAAQGISVTIDGARYVDAAPQTITAGDLSSGSMIFGNYAALNRDCGGDIHGFTITNDPNTPQLPFIPGTGQTHAPLLSKNGSLAQQGTDYQLEWSGKMAWIITQTSTASSTDTYYFGPEEEPSGGVPWTGTIDNVTDPSAIDGVSVGSIEDVE